MTLEELEAELETVKRDLGVVTILEDGREIVSVGNLLAVIHGDGGHYALAHGWGRAIIDAEAVVVALRAELETVKKDRDWFVAQCGELHANLNKAAEALEFERQNARDEQERASRILRELRQLVRAERERDEARDTIAALTTAMAEKDLEIATLTAALDERDLEAERGLEQYDRLVRERDEARAALADATTEWKARRCECGADDFCKIAQGRDEARAEVERLTREPAVHPSNLTDVVSLLEDERDELLVRVANQDAELRATREAYNEARAEVERLMHQLADATNESTHFQVMCKRETEEVERLTSELQRERKCLTETRRELASQYGMGFRRGAEAMRDECIGAACGFFMGTTGFCNGDEDALEAVLEALPIPEEP
jgi:chromosome segregation ATPase